MDGTREDSSSSGPGPAEKALADHNHVELVPNGPIAPEDAQVAQPAGPRVGAKIWFTWIHPRPDTRTLPLGYLRPGSTLEVSDPTPVAGVGCQSYVRVQPQGYVCVSRAGTLAVETDYFSAARATEPAPGPFPYEYALSVGTHMFTRIPTPEQAARFTHGRRDLPLRGWDETHDDLALDEPIAPNGDMPEFLRNGGSIPNPWGKPSGFYLKKVPRGTLIAFTRAFEANGEVWVLSTNLTVVPARGLKRFRRSNFRGVELENGIELPLAWVRRGEPGKWRRTDGRLEQTHERWALRSAVALTGTELEQDGARFLETREGNFVRASNVSVARARKPPRALREKDEKWVHAELRAGLLTLYRGARPVFSTLASPGVKNATPSGLERVESKHHVSTLTTENGEPRKFWIADVPWVVYFKRPFAIHTAFWHEDFGEPRSYGCLNVSAADGKRIFEFVDPPLPDGWGSVQGDTRMGRGSLILVER